MFGARPQSADFSPGADLSPGADFSPSVDFSPRLLCGQTLFIMLLFFVAVLPAFPLDSNLSDDSAGRGDAAAAARYALWAKNAMDRGQWEEALAGLERARDFADVSSDISYLLALARSHENKARGTVLEALNAALVVDRWNLYTSGAARLLKAENLIALRAHAEALAELSGVGKSAGEALLTLKALSGRPMEFRRFLTDTLDRYPRETGPVRVFLNFLSNEDSRGSNPSKDDLELLELIIRRLPALLLKDPELAWMTAPFVRDIAEAKRLVEAYRAVNTPVASSLPIALKLGVIDDNTALEELFGSSGRPATETSFSGTSSAGAISTGTSSAGTGSVDIFLLGEIWGLLRQEEARAAFRRNLKAYTGVITEDSDRDGIPEVSVEYREGMPVQYSFDEIQDGDPDLIVYFEAGDPVRALVLIPPEGRGAAELYKGNRKWATIRWEQYPAVLEAALDGAIYIPRPLDLYFAPVRFTGLWGSGVLFPQRDPLSPPLTRRVLVFQALRVERPSLEFNGGKEVVELNQGIPVRAREYSGDLMVSETEFLRGRPLLQRVDLDLDGRVDTVRHFRRIYRPVELEDLLDYDRDIDYTVDNLDMDW